jgi:hypothetical protein
MGFLKARPILTPISPTCRSWTSHIWIRDTHPDPPQAATRLRSGGRLTVLSGGVRVWRAKTLSKGRVKLVSGVCGDEAVWNPNAASVKVSRYPGSMELLQR